MELTSTELQKLKVIELELLKDFIMVCEQLNLKYYIIAGTLIGAIRHQGFIPWDDDIDVAMPREDYEVFMREGQELLSNDYFVQCLKTEPDLPICFAKIRNSNTTFIETSIKDFDINHGVYIDVFPLDFCPTDEKIRKRQKKKINLLTMRICDEMYLPNSKMSIKTKLVTFLLKLRYPNYRTAVKAKEKQYKLCKNSNLLVNFGGAWGDREIVPAEWFAEACDLDFEGVTVKGPREYDKLLTQIYGDYMTPPPVEKRTTHHFATVVDTGVPYTEYVKKDINNK